MSIFFERYGDSPERMYLAKRIWERVRVQNLSWTGVYGPPVSPEQLQQIQEEEERKRKHYDEFMKRKQQEEEEQRINFQRQMMMMIEERQRVHEAAFGLFHFHQLQTNQMMNQDGSFGYYNYATGGGVDSYEPILMQGSQVNSINFSLQPISSSQQEGQDVWNEESFTTEDAEGLLEYFIQESAAYIQERPGVPP
jgi:hypothetical protein